MICFADGLGHDLYTTQTVAVTVDAARQEVASAGASELGTSMNQRPVSEVSLGCPVSVSSCKSSSSPGYQRLDTANATKPNTVKGIEGMLQLCSMVPGVGTPCSVLLVIAAVGSGDMSTAGEELLFAGLPGSKLRRLGELVDTVGNLRKAGKSDAHHIIQDAAVKHLPGYDTNRAPGVQLPGGARRGTPHYLANMVQRQKGGGTYGAERRIGYKAMRRAGVSKMDARNAIEQADTYFKSLGVGPSTVTKIPRRNRR